MLRLALATVLLAPAAFAHEGGHLHPHGAEGGLLAMAAAALAAAVLAWLVLRRG
ncbi:MAG TPA: peptidase M23 [Amaricoccus sp.]|nr:peptidase M23 [Amaricoccus sp.]